jgi:hypothetical protein
VLIVPVAILTVKHLPLHMLLEVRPRIAVERGQKVAMIRDLQLSFADSLADFLQASTACKVFL